MPRYRSVLGPLFAGMFLAGTGPRAWAATPSAAPSASQEPARPAASAQKTKPPAEGEKPPKAKPADEKAAEPKRTETKTPEPKAAETKSAPAKAAETKPAPAKPAESKPAPAKPAETKPGEPKSSDSKQAASKPAESKGPEPKTPSAAKSDVKAADPTRGAPTRKVPEPPPPAKEAAKAPGSLPSLPEKTSKAPVVAKEAEKSDAAAKPSHQKGKAPKKPAASLPAGVPRPQPDADARRQVAGGPTADQVRAGKDDPELRVLREAERVLFPRALPGVTPGWSWDLPRPVNSGGPEVVASGLPPASPIAGTSPPASADLDWVKRLTLPDFPVRWDERVIKYLKFYRDSPSGRAIAKAWAKKSGKYVKALRAELGKAGLPTDLVWLSLIESGHNPTITSPAGAAGLWQFMPDAGRTYGLVIDRWVDERLDPERSTEAATRYLGDLYRRFGSWDLAMASYNMGYGGLSRAIRKFSSNDFWELSRHEAGLPWETSLYVPKIVATAIMMNNPAAFGIADVTPEPPESFDTVLVGPGTPLDAVARAAGVGIETIEAMNPQYLAGRTPPSTPGQKATSYRVRVPSGRGKSASQALALAPSQLDGLVTYVVRAGDTAESIAAAASTTEAKIRSLNRIGSQEVLAAGAVLLVPQQDRRPVEPEAPREDVVVVSRRVTAPPGKERLFYRVVSGDTLGKVADAFRVSRHELLAWNALDEGARLVPGMTLQVFVKQGTDVRVRCMKERDARVLVAGTPEFFDYYEGLNGKKRIVVAARPGDTLASVGRRYGMTVGWMERVNRRSRTDKLEPGESLIVYTDRAVGGSAPTEVAMAKLSEPVAPVPGVLPSIESLTAEGFTAGEGLGGSAESAKLP
jgi:membrane-bound lytic murein transglycosylase D